jgi:hypothetical protein
MSNKKQGEASAGYMLMKPLVETATAAGVRALYDVRVGSLIVESDGRVVGIRARRYGSDLTIRARKGVILAMGSFAYNEAMVAQYAPRIAGRPAASIEQHDGRGIQMAQRWAPIWPTWTPPKLRSSSTPSNWYAASWSMRAANATSPRTPTRAGSGSSRCTTKTTPPT